jgi:hypothetical protein
MSESLNAIVIRLNYLLEHPAELPNAVPELQQAIWEGGGDPNEESQWEVLRDLAYDLNYYQPSPRIRSKENWLFGEDRALEEIRQALGKLMKRS